jgi:hypothetical protein
MELRPTKDEPVTSLPPRVGEQDETQGTRRVFIKRGNNRPIGGYAPFEKSRSYIGMFALILVLGITALAISWYTGQIDTIGRATGRTDGNAWQSYDEGKRKDFQERQKKAIEKLKKQQQDKAQTPAPRN